MKIEIIDHQRIKRINLRQLRKCLKSIYALLGISSKNVSFLLCDNRFIIKLNKKFFKKSFPTDVISFSLSDDFEPDYLGEVVVSVEEAIRVSKIYGNAWQKELVLYFVHGILHLLGYNDRTFRQRVRMGKKQNDIMRKLFPKNATHLR